MHVHLHLTSSHINIFKSHCKSKELTAKYKGHLLKRLLIEQHQQRVDHYGVPHTGVTMSTRGIHR